MTRGGESIQGVMHHCDQGGTYASYDYQSLLAPAGNITFADLYHARSVAFEYIETFYNRFRKHSALGYKNPVEFEEKNSP